MMVDRLSKVIRVIPSNGETSSEGLTRLFRDHGTQFPSNFMRDLNRLLGMEMLASFPAVSTQPQLSHHHIH